LAVIARVKAVPAVWVLGFVTVNVAALAGATVSVDVAPVFPDGDTEVAVMATLCAS
jgi:hypothetical protein